MAQRTIELLIGRLITDERFRAQFLSAPEATLLGLMEQGFDLSRIEIAALLDTDPDVWVRGARALDARVEKVSLLDDPTAR